MNLLAILSIALGSFDLNAQESRITRLKNEKKEAPKAVKKRKNKDEELLQQINSNNKKISELLYSKSNLPNIWEGQKNIHTGEVFHGVILNTINSTNIGSPILIRANDNQGLPYNTKFSCSGVSQNKRVYTLCNRMISPNKEISINAQVLNFDGSSGVVGEFDDNKDSLIAAALITDFTKGALSIAQGRINTPFGEYRDGSARNQILQGLIETGRSSTDILTEDLKNKEPIISVDAGTEVLIYFMEAVNEY